MKKAFFIIFIFIVTLHCFSQKRSIVDEYKTLTNGKEMNILLFSDSTYIMNTYWGEYHGLWRIIKTESDSLFDLIAFYDFVFDTKNDDVFFFSHISLNDSLVGQFEELCDNSKETFVTIFDLTGKIVPFYSVCFTDSLKVIIDCVDPSDTRYKQSIPVNTRRIQMIGEDGNFSTLFKCDYSPVEGSIAFIIGPDVGRFFINKKRDIIKYQPCYCKTYMSSCSISFRK